MSDLHDARLEAAAKIIRRASFGEQSDPDEFWSDCHESERERWRVAARRALAAADAVVTVEVIADEIADAGIPRSYAPWWISIDAAPKGVLVVKHWDHNVRERDIDEDTGHGVTVTRATAAALRAAQQRAANEGALCCAPGDFCAEDADQVLQRAVYGRTYYG